MVKPKSRLRPVIISKTPKFPNLRYPVLLLLTVPTSSDRHRIMSKPRRRRLRLASFNIRRRLQRVFFETQSLIGKGKGDLGLKPRLLLDFGSGRILIWVLDRVGSIKPDPNAIIPTQFHWTRPVQSNPAYFYCTRPDRVGPLIRLAPSQLHWVSEQQ